MDGIARGATIEPSDVELAARGDELAFSRIVEAHHPDMLRLAYVIAGDSSLAQDAVQSAWATAWSKLRSVRQPARVRSWLLSIAANEARMIVRRRRRATVTQIDLDVQAPTLADPASGIARIDLVRALGRLSPEDRALLALRYVAGFDARELESVSGLSPSATRTRLSRLTARLREELGND